MRSHIKTEQLGLHEHVAPAVRISVLKMEPIVRMVVRLCLYVCGRRRLGLASLGVRRARLKMLTGTVQSVSR